MLNIILKDIKLVLSDKKSLILIILMPIVLTSILGFSLSGMFREKGSQWNLNIAVVKQYNFEEDIQRFQESMTKLSNQYDCEINSEDMLKNGAKFNPEKLFLEDFLGNDELKKSVEYKVYSLEEAKKLLNAKEISSIIVLPNNFVYDSYINTFTPFRNNIEIKVIGHPDMGYSLNITKELVNGYNNIMSSIIISKNVFMESSSKYLDIEEVTDGMSDLITNIKTNNQSVNIIEENLQGKNHINSFAYYAVSILAMFILYTATYGGKYLLGEIDDGTFSRTKVAGVNNGQIFLGKFVMMVIIVLLQSLIMIAFSRLVFKVNWVNPVLIAVTMLLSALVVGSIGVIVAIISVKTRDYKVTDFLSNIIIQVMALLGGSFVPIEQLPSVVRPICKFIPNGAIMNSYIKILEGYNLKAVLPYYCIIVINIGIFIGIAFALRGGIKNA